MIALLPMFTDFIRRLSDGALDTPVLAQSALNCKSGNAVSLRPFGGHKGFASICDWVGRPSIERLYFFICPSNVARFVMSIGVYAVQRITRAGARPDTSQKVCKGLKTELNAASAVVRIGSVERILAPILCSRITAIFWRMTLTVFGVSETSARFGFVACEMARSNDFNSAALTPTIPSRLPFGRSPGKRYNGESVKCVSVKIVKAMMTRLGLRVNDRIGISHRFLLIEMCGQAWFGVSSTMPSRFHYITI